MSGLLGYAAAGAVAGAGKGLVEDAKAARERTMEELRFARQRVLAEEDRTFRAGESQLDREFRTGEREATQEFTAQENAAQRASSAGIAAGNRALQLQLAEMAAARADARFAAEREQWSAEFGLRREALQDARDSREQDVEFRDRTFEAGRTDREHDIGFRDRTFEASRGDREQDVADRDRRTGLLETAEERANRLADRAIGKADETFNAPDGRMMGLFGGEARPITENGQPFRATDPAGFAPPEPIMDPDLPFASAVGAEGNLAGIANTVVGIFGGPTVGMNIPAPQINAAREQLRNLGVQTRTMLQDAVPGRPSNYLMQMLGDMVVDPNSWTQNPETALERAQQTAAVIRRGINDNLAIIRNPSGYSPTDVSKARQSIQTLGGLMADYQVLVDSLQAASVERQQAAPAPATGNRRRSPNATTSAPEPAPEARPRATNRQTNEVVEWDGSQWVPVQ